jgi:molybdate transport system permease protein
VPDLGPLWLTLQLAAFTTLALIVIGTPVAWWLSQTHSRIKPVIEALTALPLVLPPTVIGFYLLITMSPKAPLGAFFLSVTGQTLTFSFTGLGVDALFAAVHGAATASRIRNYRARTVGGSGEPAR